MSPFEMLDGGAVGIDQPKEGELFWNELDQREAIGFIFSQLYSIIYTS